MKKPRLQLYSQILIAMAAGVATGLVAGSSAEPLGELGKALIQLVKTLAAPLLFFAVVDAFVRTHVNFKSASRMVAISLFNAMIALGFGLAISNVFRPGAQLALPPQAAATADGQGAAGLAKLDVVKTLTGYVPSSVVQPFAENSVLMIIAAAVLVGLALRRLRSPETRSTEELVATGLRVSELILSWVVKLMPLAVFAVVAKTVGAQGLAPLKGLAAYLGAGLLGLGLHVLVTYQAWIAFAAKMKLRAFWRGARTPLAYAMGAASSLATLPVTLKALDEMKVSPQSARLAACVGTNLNNDGILLYEAMAVLFVAQAYGIHLTLGQQCLAALSCALAGFGIAGIPDAGLISLSLVLTTVGLPIEILPLLLTVDWIMGRARAMTNVLSDMTVAVVLDRSRES